MGGGQVNNDVADHVDDERRITSGINDGGTVDSQEDEQEEGALSSRVVAPLIAVAGAAAVVVVFEVAVLVAVVEVEEAVVELVAETIAGGRGEACEAGEELWRAWKFSQN